MSVFGFLKNLISPVTGIIDKAVNDKDLATQLKYEIEQSLMESADEYEKELTKRHELDMTSDSWLSKNVRPLTLVFLMSMFVLISLFDGNIGAFSVNDAYIPVYQMLLSLVFTFYFGSRGAEKIMKIYKEPSKEDS